MTDTSGQEGEEDATAKKTSGAVAPKSRRDALRAKLRKAATNVGPPTEDWANSKWAGDVDLD